MKTLTMQDLDQVVICREGKCVDLGGRRIIKKDAFSSFIAGGMFKPTLFEE